jgi:hypothetical protein
MESWAMHMRECRRNHGVSTLRQAVACGVHPSTWRRRTSAEGWVAPYRGVRIAPWAPDGIAPALAACVAAHPDSAVAGAAARWWRGVADEPQTSDLEVVVPHERRGRGAAASAALAHAAPAVPEQRRLLQCCARIRVRRCRWLLSTDVEVVRGLRLVSPEVEAIRLAGSSRGLLRAYLVDAGHAGWLDLDAVEERVLAVGPVPGRHVLLEELADLRGRGPESPFHDEVLTELLQRGYAPERRPVRIVTPLGQDLLPDIALRRWQVAIELDGDRYHRDRQQRRRDRDRLAAYASTSWRPVVVDWVTWQTRRPEILAAIDAAIASQQGLGIGTTHRPPGRPSTRRGPQP